MGTRCIRKGISTNRCLLIIMNPDSKHSWNIVRSYNFVVVVSEEHKGGRVTYITARPKRQIPHPTHLEHKVRYQPGRDCCSIIIPSVRTREIPEVLPDGSPKAHEKGAAMSMGGVGEGELSRNNHATRPHPLSRARDPESARRHHAAPSPDSGTRLSHPPGQTEGRRGSISLSPTRMAACHGAQAGIGDADPAIHSDPRTRTRRGKAGAGEGWKAGG